MPVLHLTVCQTPTRSLKCECKTQKNMHVFIHMETNGLLASYRTQSPTSHTKIPLWSGNYRSARLVPLSLPVFWLQLERDRQAKNPSIWLLTEKELKMCSDPSALWFIKDVGCSVPLLITGQATTVALTCRLDEKTQKRIWPLNWKSFKQWPI